MPANLEYRERERKRKWEVGGRPAKVIEKKGWQRSRARVKNKGDIFLLGEHHENFVAVVRKWEMLAATMKGENERQWKKKKKKKNDKTYDIPCIKLVTKKFLEVSRCSRGKQQQRNVQKKCAARAKFLFC